MRHIEFIKEFGVGLFFKIIVLGKLLTLISNKTIKEYRRNQIRKYLFEIAEPVIFKYKNLSNSEIPISNSSPIWICWWQGFADMPAISRLCYNSVIENSEGHPVFFVSKDNYKDYITLPSYLLDKLDAGKISITHFTDVLRFALLKKHGGLWIDSAIMMLKYPKNENLSFYSNKNYKKDENYISNYRWTGGVLCSTHENVVISFVYDFYKEYWSKHNMVIDFMIMDYIIELGYNNVQSIKKHIDAVPYSNPDFYALKSIFNQPFDSNLVNEITERNFLLSLNRRILCNERNKDGKLTYYGYFKQKYNDKSINSNTCI